MSTETIRDRNNDPYGTPAAHRFWTDHDWEPARDDKWRVLSLEGTVYAYERRYNAWYGFKSYEEAYAHIAEYDNVDPWA